MHSDVPFDAEMAHLDGSLVLRLVGELDLSTAPLLNERLSELASTHLRTLVLDLSALTFIDVAGLRGLLTAAWSAEVLGAAFQLVDPPPFAVATMRLVGFYPLLDAIEYTLT